MSELRDLVRAVGEAASPAVRREAERALCLALGPRIRLYGLRHLADDAAAADLTQEALLAFLEAARCGRIENLDDVERFVFGTCRNLVARIRRNERRTRSFVGAVLPLQSAELPPAFSSVDAARLALCLGKIAAREQSVVLLTFQEERSADEIAAELGTTPGNVRVLRHRALAALQRCVDGSAP